MSENDKQSTHDLHRAKVESHKPPRISTVWVIPGIALILGIAMMVNHYSNEGPKIEILFDSAEHLEAGKTKIKFLSIEIGKVTRIELNENNDGVIVSAELDKDVDHLLREDSIFWIVKPRVGAGGISGLETLLSGAYLEIIPGKSKKMADSFVGIAGIPPTGADKAGLRITLRSNSDKVLDEGTSIFYRGFLAGRIETVDLNLEENATYYDAFIRAPYNELVTRNTHFWNISGLSIESSSSGFSLQTGSLESVLAGGITFALPTGVEEGEKSKDNDLFVLYPNKNQADERTHRHGVEAIIRFDTTVRNLAVGAPVEFRGLKIGRVASLNTAKSLYQGDLRPELLLRLEPARIGFTDDEKGMKLMRERLHNWIKAGLTGRLKTGSFLTGKKYIDLVFDASKVSEVVKQEGDSLVIPADESGSGDIQDSMISALDRTEDIPLEDIGRNLNVLMQRLTRVSDNLNAVLEQSETKEIPHNLNASLEQINQTLAAFSPDEKLYQDLEESLVTLNRALHNADILLKKLKDKPNAILFDSSTGGGIIPRAATATAAEDRQHE